MRICIQCGIQFATDPLGICTECNRANALALADCDTCSTEAEFDADGHVTITHQPDCRDFAEFKQQVDALEKFTEQVEGIEDTE